MFHNYLKNKTLCLSGRERNTLTAAQKEYIMNEKQNMDNKTWYALRTFNRQEKKLSLFLTEQEMQHFIPMVYSTRMAPPKEGPEDASEPEKPLLVPAVHNLVFVQKSLSQKEMLKVLAECSTPVYVFRNPGSQSPSEISARDMEELRMLCDPQYEASVFVTQTEAEAMVGKDVRVVAGPFKGTVGRLVRKHKQYYFLKSVVGMGVMVRISRWYCEPL